VTLAEPLGVVNPAWDRRQGLELGVLGRPPSPPAVALQFLTNHVEVPSAELEIGLQMISLGPFIPRFYEQEAFLGRITLRNGYPPPYL
jgi:hypothetical protein